MVAAVLMMTEVGMMTGLVWVLAFVVVVLSVMVVGLLRSHAVIVRALHEAGFNLDPDGIVSGGDGDAGSVGPVSVADPVRTTGSIDLRTMPGVPTSANVSGRRGHDLSGELPGGGVRSISVKGRESTLLAFLSTGCGTCGNFWDAFDRGVDLPPDVRLVVVTKGPEAESPADVTALAPASAVTLMSSRAWDDYGVPVAPYFALVDGASGVVIGEGAAHGWDLVGAMLNRAVADTATARAAERATEPVSRRDMLLGRNRHQAVDDELAAIGIEPGDPRLHHASAHALLDEGSIS